MDSEMTDIERDKELERKINEIYNALVGDFEKPGLIGRVVSLEKYKKTQIASLTLVVGIVLEKVVELIGA